ncbi:MAG: flagellar basal-body P-ring protein [Planctomycetota bacterium]|nr:flagellar basal-body P-ring protein [Planctomycetota bacterium]
MRRIHPRRWMALGLGAMVLSQVVGAGPLGGKGKSPIAKKSDIPLKVEETIGDLAKVPPMWEIRVEGVGLVVGLNGTGSEAAPGGWRTKLLDQMRKAQLHNAEQYLASPNHSLVLIRGKIPAGITTEDVFDVEIELDANSTTTSLAGGQLIRADLFQVEFSKKGEQLPEGKKFATAYGPIMTGTEAKPDDPKVGRILGGARVKTDQPYVLIINEKRKSFQTASIIQQVVNARFNSLKGIDQEGMAKAKTDQYLTLNIPTNYHHNQYRFFQVLENLPVLDSPALRAARMERWGKELLDPKTAGAAAIRLEGLGRNATDVLKAGLGHPHPQVRFFAAEALSYLGSDAGVNVLSDAAKNRPEFRAYALAALAAMDQPASLLRLRELMSEPDVQVRYGAFNALRIVDKTDPNLGRVRVREDEPEPQEGDDDAMAIKIASAKRKSARKTDPFELYVVDCEGPPLIHVARTRRCEIVVFGKGQALQTPVVLGVGPIQINASDGDKEAKISRIGSEALDGPDRRVTTSLALSDVIREVAHLGATYPEILSLLQSAERQRNLPPTDRPSLVVDALPTAVPAYSEAQIAGKDATLKSDPGLEKTGLETEKAPRKGLLNRVMRRPNR